ncbi:TPA: hypothetical protein ACJKCD_000649, partial [Neisseria meningitidis]
NLQNPIFEKQLPKFKKWIPAYAGMTAGVGRCFQMKTVVNDIKKVVVYIAGKMNTKPSAY